MSSCHQASAALPFRGAAGGSQQGRVSSRGAYRAVQPVALSAPNRQQPLQVTRAARRRASRASRLRVDSLDAAQPFDQEQRLADQVRAERQLKIGIVGFGNFGQFLGKRFVEHGHRVLATSRGDYSAAAAELGASYYRDIDDFCEEHPDIVIISTSIISMEKVLSSIPLQRLKRSTLFVDVLSVKEFPKRLFLNTLPPEFDILCLHPMFGPDSGKDAWTNLPLMYDAVRISDTEKRRKVAASLLEIFASEGCRMVDMTCEEHDRQAASTQFITHTVGRMLGEMGLDSTTINTKGYESLLSLVNNTANDSFDLYYGLFMYNQNATQELQRLEQAFDAVRQQLMDSLHEKLRSELFGPPPPQDGDAAQNSPMLLGPPQNGVPPRAMGGGGTNTSTIDVEPQ